MKEIIREKIKQNFVCGSCGCNFITDEYILEKENSPINIPDRLKNTYCVDVCPKCGNKCSFIF